MGTQNPRGAPAQLFKTAAKRALVASGWFCLKVGLNPTPLFGSNLMFDLKVSKRA